MKRVHSVAFFRNDASAYEGERCGTARGVFFVNFLRTLVRAHHAVFPDWELRIHHDDRVRAFPEFAALERMRAAGLLTLAAMGEAATLCGAMLWRLSPLWDEDVEIVMCRDLDSLPMHRDRKMVEEAMASGAVVHAILDSESHCGPYMGGTIAIRAAAFRDAFPRCRNLGDFIAAHRVCDLTRLGDDQRVLNAALTHPFLKRTFVHQRRRDIMYPEAMATRPVAPQETELDKVVRHVGAGYDVEKALAVIREHYRRLDVAGLDRIEMLETLRMPREGPWYVPSAVAWLESVIRPDWRVYESGGGASSAWYAKRVSKVVTQEPDRFWRVMIEAVAPSIEFHEPGPEGFDLVAVDGDPIECRLAAIHLLAPWVERGGYLLLDNSDEFPELSAILPEWPRQDYKAVESAWTTSVWRRPL